MENQLTHEAFRGQLNKEFLVLIEGANPLPLELVEVSELTVTPRQEMFAIVFRGPGPDMLEQRIHTLKNDQMGEIKLFLVPIKSDNESVSYEAVFNRVVKKV